MLRRSAAAALALLACSCGGREPVYPVRGKVLDAGGRPAVGALVVFHPVAAGAARAVARADADGNFALTTYAEGDGAPAGEYVVTIEWPAARKSPFEPEGPDRLQGRLRDSKTSKIRFRVEKNSDNEVPAIRLP